MSITDWFSDREGRRYTRLQEAQQGDVPEGVWSKCEQCKHIVYEGELAENLRVCPYCQHHFVMSARERVEMLADPGTFEEIDTALTSGDPLGFSAQKTYPESLSQAKERSGLEEAFVAGRAEISGKPVIVGSMEFQFIAASMGSVVGEKVSRAFEQALAEKRGVVLAAASGGARMQEGMLSLMQMAKTSAAAERLGQAGLPYVSILTHPTTGGVTASFAVLADVIIAEPGALVGFAGPRVIEQTIRQKLPKGFQTAEFLVDHGMIDEVVPRAELRDRVALVLEYLTLAGGEARG